jgi:hypothetical protein
MERVNWSDSEIEEMKIEIDGTRRNKAERMSRRLGVDTESVKEKMKEMEIGRRLRKIASFFGEIKTRAKN